MANETADELPRLVLREDDLLIRLLRDGQRWLAENPKLARLLVQSFVAEGRRFADTPSGRHWQAALASSDAMRRGRLLWQACGLDALLDGEPALVPSDWLELVVATVVSADLEAVLSRLMMEEVRRGTISPL